jgi:hypothetical protein
MSSQRREPPSQAEERSGVWHCDYRDALKERRRKSTSDHPALSRRAVMSADKVGSRWRRAAVRSACGRLSSFSPNKAGCSPCALAYWKIAQSGQRAARNPYRES